MRVAPETANHVANLARDGGTADLLPYQASDALRLVPTPRLALVQIMDDDIRCDGSDPAHLPEFRASVHEAVATIVKTSPGVTVILVGGAGRPAGYAAAVAALPETPADLVGTQPCTLFSADQVVNKAEVARITGLMEAYEAELAKACRGIPQCRTAAAVWPEVAKALGLPSG